MSKPQSARERLKQVRGKAVLDNVLYGVNNTYSLDFETTGTGHKSRVWSIGMTGGLNSTFNHEFFLEDAIKGTDGFVTLPDGTSRPATIEEMLMQAHTNTGAEHFGARQMGNGSFKPYQDALLANKGSTFDKAMTTFSDQLLRDPGIILIQNANFENGRLLDALRTPFHLRDGTSLSKGVADRFVRDVLGRDISEGIDNNFVNVAESIRKSRQDLNQVLEDFKLSHGEERRTEAFNEVLAARDRLKTNINKEVHAKLSKGFSVPIELMDLTLLTQIDLAEKGALNKDLIGYGRGMEVLAELILQEQETHMALDDTHKQVSVFQKYSEASHQIRNGNIPDYMQRYVKALNENENNMHDVAFLKQLRNRVEEASRGKPLSEERLDKLLNQSLSYYANAPETNVDRDAVAAKIKDSFRQSKEAVRATSVLQLIDEFQERIPQLNNGEALLPTNAVDVVKSMKIESKVALGVGAIAAIGLISSITDRQKDPPKPTTYNELYDDVKLGAAYADWKERNGAHRSIY